jgi:exopolysaccharide biosynthesis polyprenyl glycosylphosphotransferase
MTSSYGSALNDGARQRESHQQGVFVPTRVPRHAVLEMSASERRGFVLRRLSVAADVAALLLVGALTAACLQLFARPVLSADVLLFLLFIPLWPLIGISMRAYHPHSVGRGLSVNVSDEFATVFRVSTMWAWFLMVARSVSFAETTQLLPVLLVWMLSVPLILGSRSLLRRLVRRQGWYHQPVMVIGRPSDAAQISSRIDRHPEWGLSVAQEIGVHTDNGRWPDPAGEQVASANGGIDAGALLFRARELDVSRVIFATPPAELDARTDVTRAFIEAGTQVDFVPGEAEILRSGAEIGSLEGLPLMSMPGARPPRSWGALKRIMDLSVAVPALIAASPIIAYAAVRIKLDSPGPVFYRQTRAGKDGRHFEFLKLRTMSDDADERLPELAGLSLHGNGLDNGVFKAPADPRVTRAGRSLRRRSLDELPQLWNVVRGDMSLVGPRPLPVFEDERVAGHYELRRHVRPGMTGPWQVNGRSDIPFSDMLRLDYSYVLNWSLAADLKILAQTFEAVIRGRGAY